jgi:hypothetical protein
LTTWKERGLNERELNCYTGADDLPSDWGAELVRHPYYSGPTEDAQLFLLSPNPFPDDIFSDDVLYMISGGKGYAVDCGSNHRAFKVALGFSPDSPPPLLTPDDDVYIASRPASESERHPILRCENDAPLRFRTWNETLPANYFQYPEMADALLRFHCPSAEEFFAPSASATRSLPKEALKDVLLSAQDYEAKSRVFHVGCGPAARPRYVYENWTTKEGGFWEAQQWLSGDFNGDGIAEVGKVFSEGGQTSIDIHASDGNHFKMERWATNSGPFRDGSKWLAADFDGDGLDDIANVYPEGVYITIDVRFSSGYSFWSPQRMSAQDGHYGAQQVWFAGDFDGDGYADLAKTFTEGSNLSFDVHLWKGWSGFKMERWATGLVGYLDSEWTSGDFNGDGRTDLAEAYLGTYVDVYPSEPGLAGGPTRGRFGQQAWGSFPLVAKRRFRATDVNADGKADLVRIFEQNGSIAVEAYKSSGSEFAPTAEQLFKGGVWDDASRWFAAFYTGTDKPSFTRVWNQDAYCSMNVIRAR